jgi:hypothetical protein
LECLFLFREKLELIELLDFSKKFDLPKWIKKYFFARQQISFDSVNRLQSWNWYNPWIRKKLTNWKKNSWKKINFMKYPWYANMRIIKMFSLEISMAILMMIFSRKINYDQDADILNQKHWILIDVNQ